MWRKFCGNFRWKSFERWGLWLVALAAAGPCSASQVSLEVSSHLEGDAASKDAIARRSWCWTLAELLAKEPFLGEILVECGRHLWDFSHTSSDQARQKCGFQIDYNLSFHFSGHVLALQGALMVMMRNKRSNGGKWQNTDCAPPRARIEGKKLDHLGSPPI